MCFSACMFIYVCSINSKSVSQNRYLSRLLSIKPSLVIVLIYLLQTFPLIISRSHTRLNTKELILPAESNDEVDLRKVHYKLQGQTLNISIVWLQRKFSPLLRFCMPLPNLHLVCQPTEHWSKYHNPSSISVNFKGDTLLTLCTCIKCWMVGKRCHILKFCCWHCTLILYKSHVHPLIRVCGFLLNFHWVTVILLFW